MKRRCIYQASNSLKDIKKLMDSYPRKHPDLPDEYKKVYVQHYKENREGKTRVSRISKKVEGWMHKIVAKSSGEGLKTLEIGAGTLNQLDFEQPYIYDIIEPFQALFKDFVHLKDVRNVYSDISEIHGKKYDRIISVACFEHIENLPELVCFTVKLLKRNGKLCISIPNEGRFLWKFSYTVTTGREFERRYGLKYKTMIEHEHINTADEIEKILKYYYKNVKVRFFGFGKSFSLFRYYECSIPDVKRG